MYVIFRQHLVSAIICAISLVGLSACSGGGGSGLGGDVVPPAGPTPLIDGTQTPILATVGMPYQFTFALSQQGTAPYGWSVNPAIGGLNIDSTGMLSGTPTLVGVNNINVTVVDSKGKTDTKPFTIQIDIGGPPIPLGITTPTVNTGEEGVAYTTGMNATGGTLPYTWSINPDPPAPGLSLDSSNGTISGIPTTQGTYPITITVNDNAGDSDFTIFDIIIDPPAPAAIIITNSSPLTPNAVEGQPWSVTFAATGGSGMGYMWSNSLLPAGMAGIGDVDSTSGIMTGTPTTAGGPYAFNVTVQDSVGATETQLFELIVDPGPGALDITNTSPLTPNAVEGQLWSGVTFAATGGSGMGYMWSNAALPGGMAGIGDVDSTSGLMTGTPTTAGGPFFFDVTVSDSLGATWSETFQLTIDLPPVGFAVTSANPPQGANSGGNSVTVFGAGFDPGNLGTDVQQVRFNDIQASNIVVVSDVELICITPAMDPGVTGQVNVRVRVGGTWAILTNGYEYMPIAPAPTSLTPLQGPEAGNYTVTIYGTEFAPQTTTAPITGVTFDGVPATNIIVISDTELTCTAPSSTAGPAIDVVLTNSVGDGTLAGSFQYYIVSGGPQILSAIASDNHVALGETGPGPSDLALIQVDDLLVITFDQATNGAGSGLTPANIDTVLAVTTKTWAAVSIAWSTVISQDDTLTITFTGALPQTARHGATIEEQIGGVGGDTIVIAAGTIQDVGGTLDASGGGTVISGSFGEFWRGDYEPNHIYNINDLVRIIGYINGTVAAPVPLLLGDVDADGDIDSDDLTLWQANFAVSDSPETVWIQW